MDNLVQDLRYTIRSLVRQPSFALTAILTLALGIGATTTMFGVVNAVILQPLPFRDASKVVAVTKFWTKTGVRSVTVSAPDFDDWKARSHSFAALGNYWGTRNQRHDRRNGGLRGRVPRDARVLRGAWRHGQSGAAALGRRAARRQSALGRHHGRLLAPAVRRCPRRHWIHRQVRRTDLHDRRCPRAWATLSCARRHLQCGGGGAAGQGFPRRPQLPGDRPAQRRRDDRTGARRDAGDRAAARNGVPRHQRGQVGRRGVAPGVAGRRHTTDALHPVGGGQPGDGHRVRECRQSPARARHRSRARDGGPRRGWGCADPGSSGSS